LDSALDQYWHVDCGKEPFFYDEDVSASAALRWIMQNKAESESVTGMAMAVGETQILKKLLKDPFSCLQP
jgi:hypothetical protein